jgi:uncharacterized protein with PIN domain
VADLSPTPFVRNFRMPDKIGATVISIIVAVAALYGLWRIEPILIDLAENTLYLGAMALVLILGGSTLWQSREAIWYWQQNQIRKFRRAVIGEDPIGILDSVIKRLRHKIEEIEESMAQAQAALNQQFAAIKQAQGEAANEARLAKVAKETGKPLTELKQHAMASERWAKAAAELQPDADKMQMMQTRYQEALELANANMADADNQKRVMALKVRTTEAKKKAFAAFKTLFGASAEWQMWGDAIEIIEQRSYEAEAQIDQLLQSVSPQIASQKLQQEADAQSALDRLGLLTKEPAVLPSGDVVDGELLSSTTNKSTGRR